jgi:hypothetical protein
LVTPSKGVGPQQKVSRTSPSAVYGLRVSSLANAAIRRGASHPRSRVSRDRDRLDHDEGTQRHDTADLRGIRRRGVAARAREGGITTLQWMPPQGHADIAPSRYERIEGDGYLTINLLDRPRLGQSSALEPAAGSAFRAAPCKGASPRSLISAEEKDAGYRD